VSSALLQDETIHVLKIEMKYKKEDIGITLAIVSVFEKM